MEQPSKIRPEISRANTVNRFSPVKVIDARQMLWGKTIQARIEMDFKVSEKWQLGQRILWRERHAVPCNVAKLSWWTIHLR
jgi:hypothetical protein